MQSVCCMLQEWLGTGHRLVDATDPARERSTRASSRRTRRMSRTTCGGSLGVLLLHLVTGMPLFKTNQNDNVSHTDGEMVLLT